jgi:hypothetical protein
MAEGDDVKHVWACKCRTETEVPAEQMRDGAVFQCPGCKMIWGCVRGPYSYGSKWVPITPELAEFHRLLPSHKPDDDDD